MYSFEAGKWANIITSAVQTVGVIYAYVTGDEKAVS